MGKKQHSKDRMFLTATEWKHSVGGFKDKAKLTRHNALPFDRCAISFTPFEDPVCTAEGHVFDIVNIVPHLKKKGTNPVTGAKLTAKDLIKLTFHKNTDGQYICPLTYKVFNKNSHIVAIKTSGQVYSYEGILEMNINPKYWEDLMTGKKFTRADIITIQDPKNYAKREIGNFHHIKQKEEAERKRAEPKPVANTNPAQKDGPKSMYTTKYYSGSLTSTTFTPQTKAEKEVLSDEQIREQWYSQLRGSGKKAYVSIKTTLGDINAQIHCDLVPRIAHNFLELCKRKYYDKTTFHRLIPGFMLQGGDPKGDGTGGAPAWGKTVKDEFHDSLSHADRGILSMANAGKNTNKSQFFITFGACNWLDKKHSVFGNVVGGMNVLAALEQVPTNTKTNKPKEKIGITSIQVFSSPFDEEFKGVDEETMAKEAQHKKNMKDRNKRKQYYLDKRAEAYHDETQKGSWFSAPQPEVKEVTITRKDTGVGKYIQPSLTIPAPKQAARPPPPKKKKTTGGYGNFGNW